ncbi:DUF3048 domain-containing protein [candidate division WWE3 bacterium]|uniref:DUF3048 domain-containing protein n=1 Tax=candidate division WWE3 bacterium TaxID=2053526 RepID=A0A7X9HG66_UNCKA|nr:DUF3048 domain-containing protein [candidate division WWE3 bacterium]
MMLNDIGKPVGENNFPISPQNGAGANNTQFYPGGSSKKPFNGNKNTLYGVLGVVVALLIIGIVSFVLFRSDKYKILSPYINKVKDVVEAPKIMNPLTGELFSEEEAAAWSNNRPLAVMVNNHLDARPQSGLVDADLIYEIVAEGGITRYLAFFLSKEPDKIGPVRSTREYYLVLVKELGDAMLMHIGWSPQALEAIETWPVRSLGRGGAAFWRDQARIDSGIAIEHTAYVKGSDLRTLGNDLGWEGTRETKTWTFKDDGPIDTTQQCLVGECGKYITIDFWYKGDYTGMFTYDRATNTYLRYTGYDSSDKPVQLFDQESKEPIRVKNVVVQFVKESSIVGDEKNRLTYELVGSGSAIVFTDGKATKATWAKTGRDERTMFYDESGKEIAFNRGKFWISVVPDRNVDLVVY